DAGRALRIHPLRLARRRLSASRRAGQGVDRRQGVRSRKRARMGEDPEFEAEVGTAAEPGRLGGLRRRGIYLLPNLFTTGVLFCGFFAIVQAMNGRFEIGAVAIYVAMVLDGMDGRVARWTNTQTDFGFRPSDWLAIVTWVIAVFAGITMVSNIPFYSFKEVNWRRRVPLWVILASVLGMSVVASRPSLVLFALFMAYSLSGYVMWA